MSIPRAITGISKADSVLSHLSQPPVTLSVPNDVPTASPSALSFIQKIDITDLKYTFFEDDLMTFIDEGNEIGFYKSTVKEGCYKGDTCIAVEARSEGIVEGVPCFTDVEGYLNTGLQTIYQRLHEVVRLPQGGQLDRVTVMEMDDSVEGYRVHKEIKQGIDKREVLERVFPRAVMDGYISEGANIVLQRVLIAKGLPDYFDVVSFDADTNLCLASYKDLAATKISVDSPGPTELRCYGIERRLRCVTDVPVTWHTYFLSDGHLISRVQVGSPVLMRVRAVPDRMQHDEFLPAPTFARPPLDWQDDLQLSRMFQDRKEELASANRQYIRTHPELQHLVADFLQALLAHKPADTVRFAGDFFATFSNRFIYGTTSQVHSERSGILLSDRIPL